MTLQIHLLKLFPHSNLYFFCVVLVVILALAFEGGFVCLEVLGVLVPFPIYPMLVTYSVKVY